MEEMQETEITLGTGRLLTIFFALVMVCAVFFGVGYTMGRSSAKAATVVSDAPSSSLPVPVSERAKPSATRSNKPKADCDTPDCKAGKSTSDELTFYKAVEQKGGSPQLMPGDKTATDAAPAPTAQAPAEQPPAELANKAASALPAFVVQIAAVSKKEDADALVSALRKKQYPVIVVNNVAEDKLFHVQVGPFADVKDAEAMRAKLMGDGYNPILKR